MEPTTTTVPQEELPPLRMGIMGTARIARRLVADMQATERVRVVAIASRDSSRSTWYAQQYGIQRAFGSYEELLACADVDAVYIPLPPSLHAQWTIAAAQAGKHVLCEKPLVTSVEEWQALDQACRQHRVVWLDATGWLHHERTQAMREVIDSQLGSLRHITVAVSFFEPFQSSEHRLDPELGGGCLLDLGWYGAGLVCWAKQSLPKVEACVGNRRGEIWNRCTALLRWDDGTTGSINCAYDTSSRKWFEIAGDQRSLICDDFTRPWPDRPARFWIHDRSGNVTSVVNSGNQEVRMIASFRDMIHCAADVKSLQQQAHWTQRLIGAMTAALPMN